MDRPGVYRITDTTIELRWIEGDIVRNVTIGPDVVEGYTFDRKNETLTDEWEAPIPPVEAGA